VKLWRISAQAIYDALLKRGRGACITTLSPDDLRRTFASDLLDVTGDVSDVQKLLGQANVQTTMRYDRRGEAAKREDVNLLHLPKVFPKSKGVITDGVQLNSGSTMDRVAVISQSS
jgi:integrase